MGSLAPEGPVGAHAAARHGHVTALATLAEAAGPWPLVPPRPARPAPRKPWGLALQGTCEAAEDSGPPSSRRGVRLPWSGT